MEGNGKCLLGEISHSIESFDTDGSEISGVFLDRVGEVALTQNSDGLSWKLVESGNNGLDGSVCLGMKLKKWDTAIKFSDIYAVEYTDWGLVHEFSIANAGGCLMDSSFEMYRFMVHGIRKSNTKPDLWAPCSYTFAHKDSQACKIWVNRINTSLNSESDRPKNLLVFVHPRSGKGNGRKTWETVAPIFSRAKVKTKVIVTERAGHAFDTTALITSRELHAYDGIIAVGGDGFFNEILNGLLLSRHKAPYPPRPTESDLQVQNDSSVVLEADENVSESSNHNEDESPLLMLSGQHEATNLRTEDNSSQAEHDPEFSFPNEHFRFGIIPAGSTDAIVICTTGARDPLTSALHIVLGKRVRLDIAQVVRWKTSVSSKDEPLVRYAASFAGYGFYGDVITESEKFRWMGPTRYDYAGTKIFLSHRSYEAEVAYLEVESETQNSSPNGGSQSSRTKGLPKLSKRSERVVCRANCSVCSTSILQESSRHSSSPPYPKESRWLRCKGRYISVGAAVISNRNERAPDGLVAEAHLSDGFLHLILVKDCPRPLYLWHLTHLARKGGNPLDFDFVEHHKTPAFTFTSVGKQSVWNVDGELIRAHQLSAQVLRGLINLFAAGPEV